MRLGELARVECVAPPTLTKIVTQLETEGLVARTTDPDDRRSAVVALDASGPAPRTPASGASATPSSRSASACCRRRARAARGRDRADHEARRTRGPTSDRARACGSSPTFASLSVRNYRIYFNGQVVSLAGTWMQTVAQGLLVVKLTDSATVLGFVVAVQMMPVLIFGLWAGVVADRLPKRTLLIVTQVLAAACALTLGVLVATDAVRLWMVFVMAALLGIVQAFDNPARQAFVSELVPPHQLANAIGLNSVMVNLARIVGPGTAGLLTRDRRPRHVLLLQRRVLPRGDRGTRAHPAERAAAGPTVDASPGSSATASSYVRHTPVLFVTLLLMGVVGTLAYEFPVTLPILAKRAFGNEDIYGPMSALQGAGAVAGGLWVASRFKLRNPAVLAVVSMLLGVVILAVSAAPTLRGRPRPVHPHGRGQHRVHLDRQHDPAARVRPHPEGSRDGAVVDRAHRLDHDRRPVRRLDRRPVRRPQRPRHRRDRGLVAGAVTYPALHRLGESDSRPRDPLPQERAVGGILPSPPS